MPSAVVYVVVVAVGSAVAVGDGSSVGSVGEAVAAGLDDGDEADWLDEADGADADSAEPHPLSTRAPARMATDCADLYLCMNFPHFCGLSGGPRTDTEVGHWCLPNR